MAHLAGTYKHTKKPVIVLLVPLITQEIYELASPIEDVVAIRSTYGAKKTTSSSPSSRNLFGSQPMEYTCMYNSVLGR